MATDALPAANPGSGPKPLHLQWVDFYKGVSILFVVLIHVLGRFISLYHAGSLRWEVLSLLHCAVDCAVPAFILLSALLNGISLLRNNNIERFYRSRLKTILSPYILWSIIYYIFSIISSRHSFSAAHMLYLILIGKAYEHLYFLWILLQLLLIMPFLVLLYRSKPPLWKTILTGFILAIGFKLFSFYLLSPVAIVNRSIFRYILVIGMGLWLSSHVLEIQGFLRKAFLSVFLTAVAGAYLSFPTMMQLHNHEAREFQRIHTASNNIQKKPAIAIKINNPTKNLNLVPQHVMYSNQKTVIQTTKMMMNEIGKWAYNVGASLLIIIFSVRYCRRGFLSRVFEGMGKRSMQIYLVHPLILAGLDKMPGFLFFAGRLTALALYTIIAIVLSVLFAYLMEKARLAPLLFGR
jgi:surface polysaccharide O-acyltransferase-like enzyme